jgi:hypothetical protein
VNTNPNWFEQPEQELATGGVMRQWLRRDDYNGMVTKTPRTNYTARWVNYRSCRTKKDVVGKARMEDMAFPTLKEAQAHVEEQVALNPPLFRHGPRKERIA